jgi:hypothetical protein
LKVGFKWNRSFVIMGTQADAEDARSGADRGTVEGAIVSSDEGGEV